jgi:hypothetical protein
MSPAVTDLYKNTRSPLDFQVEIFLGWSFRQAREQSTKDDIRENARTNRQAGEEWLPLSH